MNNSQKITPTVIGIDIGAHTSKVAAVVRGAIDVLTNEANFRQTPSIVGYGDGERKIGETVNVKLKYNFMNTVVSPMRYLGSESLGAESLAEDLKYCPCPTELNENQLTFNVKQDGIALSLKPEQVLASYLTQLKSIISCNNLDDKLISIAVPSYFTQAERKGVLSAAKIAKLSNVRLVDQSIAVGLDYGVFKKSEIGEEGKTVIFVDLGHSKLSITALKFKGEHMEIIAQNHNRNLGCRNIDSYLFNHYAAIFKEKTGLDLSSNKKACLKLLEVIQRQRKILTGINETDLSIDCLMEDEDFSEQISREVMLNVAQTVFQTLKDNLTQFKEILTQLEIPIKEVELVGGGSRIPAVINIINSVFEVPTSRTINSSETIANGATLYSVQQSNLFRLQTFKVVNRSYYPLKASWKPQSDEDFSSQVVCEANQLLPCNKKISVPVKDNTQINLFYGICDDQKSGRILNIKFEPSQSDNEAQISLLLSSDGLIEVKQVTSTNGNKLSFKVENYGEIAGQELTKLESKQREMYVKDFQTVKKYEKKNDLQSFIFHQLDKLKSKEFSEYFPGDEADALRKYLQQLEEQTENNDNKYSLRDYELKAKEAEKRMSDAYETVKRKKADVIAHVSELEKLKKTAADRLQYISSKFRSSRNVSRVYEQIKQVHDWIQEVIEETKKTSFSKLPIVSNEMLQAKYTEIESCMKNLVQPQHDRYPEQEGPFGAFGFHQPEQRNPFPQRQRRRQQYDPFMSRSGFFPSGFNSFF